MTEAVYLHGIAAFIPDAWYEPSSVRTLDKKWTRRTLCHRSAATNMMFARKLLARIFPQSICPCQVGQLTSPGATD
eukprot:9470759-Pyramimonas_sp.AAC.1